MKSGSTETDTSPPPNVPRISRRRVIQHARQQPIRCKNEAGSNWSLDQAVGCMRLLARALKKMTPPNSQTLLPDDRTAAEKRTPVFSTQASL